MRSARRHPWSPRPILASAALISRGGHIALRCTSRAIERKLASLAFYLTRPQVNLGVRWLHGSHEDSADCAMWPRGECGVLQCCGKPGLFPKKPRRSRIIGFWI